MENQKRKIWQYLQALPNNVGNAILGKPMPDVDSVDLSGVNTTTPEFKENMGGAVDIKVGNNPRVGGLLPDISAGYRENSSRPMEFSNLQAGLTPDGRNKGAAYRFGEFAGTAARLLDNPLVRGAITYGISKKMGDKNPLNEALAATVGTQQNRMKDKLYRDALQQQGIDASGVRGWVNDDVYKNLSLGSYRNKNLDTKLYLGQLNDNTKRAKLINTMLNYGELDPTSAMDLMNQYGIAVTDLDTSNQTKLLPYKQYALKNGWNLGWANYGIKADKAAQEKEINDAVIKAIEGMGIKNNNGKNTVIIEAPDGTRKEVPASQKDYYIKKGGKVIG